MACGGEGVAINSNVALGLPPYVSTAAPAASVGGTLLLSGFGFSSVAAENILAINDTAVGASQYALAAVPSGDSIEELTFTLPAAVTAGSYTGVLLVSDDASNSFTVTVNP